MAKKKRYPPQVSLPTAPPEPPATLDDGARIELPRPTAWPMTLALGITLLAAGLVTNLAFSLAGFVMSLVALVGWLRQLSPAVGIEYVALRPQLDRARPAKPSIAPVEALHAGVPGHRMRIPEKVHPYSAGVKGGAVGGIAMAATALVYGLVSGRGLLYPVNLLAGMVLPGIADMTGDQLRQFDAAAFVAATVIHVVASLAVGLFFGVLLPTLPRGPVLWGGLVSPILWTGGIYAVMRVLNPVMNGRVDWRWFLVSQFAFGIAAGIVVVRSEKVYVDRERRRLGMEPPEEARS